MLIWNLLRVNSLHKIYFIVKLMAGALIPRVGLPRQVKMKDLDKQEIVDPNDYDG